jgi:predicted phosphodiesterase
MIGYPSNVLVLADYPHPHFEERILKKVDFVLSCGNVEFAILEEIHERLAKPIFAVKGHHDPSRSFPDFVTDVHLKLVQHRN